MAAIRPKPSLGRAGFYVSNVAIADSGSIEQWNSSILHQRTHTADPLPPAGVRGQITNWFGHLRRLLGDSSLTKAAALARPDRALRMGALHLSRTGQKGNYPER
jgi:hypothetical protein